MPPDAFDFTPSLLIIVPVPTSDSFVKNISFLISGLASRLSKRTTSTFYPLSRIKRMVVFLFTSPIIVPTIMIPILASKRLSTNSGRRQPNTAVFRRGLALEGVMYGSSRALPGKKCVHLHLRDIPSTITTRV
jgi:hypothetical protein